MSLPYGVKNEFYYIIHTVHPGCKKLSSHWRFRRNNFPRRGRISLSQRKGSGKRMMISVETYLRRGRRLCQRMVLDPKIRSLGAVLAYGGGGFLLSAASLGNAPQPFALGLIVAVTGWRAVLMALGAMAGYPTFWGEAGLQGIVWSAAGGLLALLLGKRVESREQPLMIPAIASLFTAVTGLSFQILLKDDTGVVLYFLRIGLTYASGVLLAQAARGRDAITDWFVGGVAVLALAQVSVTRYFGLGYIAAGVMAVASAFPAAALAGLGLDLAQITRLPMTAVLCMAYFIRMIPFDKKWQHYAAPGFGCLIVMAACGIWDTTPLPGLLLGGACASLLPPRPQIVHRRGETGAAQVRLELSAEVMASTQQLLMEMQPPPIDEEAILQLARDRACASCSARKTCREKDNLSVLHLENPLEADCKKQGRLIPELRRGQEQLRTLKADRQRQKEYRLALQQQYQFLASYLRDLADRLPRRGEIIRIEFRVEAAARSKGKERANGDKCLAFPGPGCSYFVLLCDGMGTGLGAAQEGQSAADLLRQMLLSGFPPEHSLRTLNNLLALRGSAGAVTIDLAEIRLDTGHASVYKWGAAPSWLLRRSGAEKIGTATPPPGISVDKTRETVEKLSLRRGEVLILLSDGVDGEEVLRQSVLTPDAPLGELAAKILEGGCGEADDDATAAVIKLRPTSLATS